MPVVMKIPELYPLNGRQEDDERSLPAACWSEMPVSFSLRLVFSFLPLSSSSLQGAGYNSCQSKLRVSMLDILAAVYK